MTDENLTDEEIAVRDELAQEIANINAGYPSPPAKDSIFKFFREILHTHDSKKVANLEKEELGKPRLPTRAYLDIGLYAQAEGLEKVSKYFDDKAELIAATSMGRRGFLAQLFVTQIKKEQKVNTSQSMEKKHWWQKPQPQESEPQ